MFTFIWFLIGIIVPAVAGWHVLQMLEGRTRVLWTAERVALGFVLGLTLGMFCAFILHIATGLPLALWLFLSVFAAMIIVPAAVVRRFGASGAQPDPPATSPPLTTFWIVLLAILLLWTGIKLSAATLQVVATPTYFDDALDNWNLRGKLYYVDQALTLTLPGNAEAGGISSYPPAVPLAKAWMAHLAGAWSDGLVNALHLVWHLAVLTLVFCALRRMLPLAWSLLGTYALASLPLFHMHGTNAYADVFPAAHLLAAVLPLFHAMRTEQPNARLAFLRISALAIALLPFTKNEGLVLYLPALVLLAAGCVWQSLRTNRLSAAGAMSGAAWLIGFPALGAVPWIAFKWMHGLPFGNAKGLPIFDIGWRENVVASIAINTFFEANWLLLPIAFIAVLIAGRRAAFRMPLLVLTAFVLALYGFQLALFLFTGLAAEALMQTGYARGLIHIVPVIVTLTTVLLYRILNREQFSVVSDQNVSQSSAHRH